MERNRVWGCLKIFRGAECGGVCRYGEEQSVEVFVDMERSRLWWCL
jgi:hypothetical protein